MKRILFLACLAILNLSNTYGQDLVITQEGEYILPDSWIIPHGVISTENKEVHVAPGINIANIWVKCNMTEISNTFPDGYPKVNEYINANKYPLLLEGSYGILGNEGKILYRVTQEKTPVITSRPYDKMVSIGETLTLSVEVTGINLSYQWIKDDNPIPGATEPTYTKTNIQPSDAGSYTCIVSNDAGSASFDPITIRVYSGVTITSHPEDQTITVGETLTLSVIASGVDLSYVWYKDYNPIPEATSPTYTKVNAQLSDAGEYFCNVYSIDETKLSNMAMVTVNPGTNTEEPVNSEEVTNKGLQVYPLEGGRIRIEGDHLKQARVYSLNGELLLSARLMTRQATLEGIRGKIVVVQVHLQDGTSLSRKLVLYE